MKNNYGRFKIIVLISLILLLFAVTIKASAGNALYFKGLKAPQKEIRGTVTDQQGSPIAGVAVYIKGRSSGTVTNTNGEYYIRAVPGDTLVFSYLGFKQIEIILEQQDQVNIQMKEDISSLGEVEINAGYYNTTRRESTGNISRVTAEEIELQPVVNPLQALQGRMAGVEIIPGGNLPGMAPTIRIRGQNSLRSEGNFPLYIIDGVPINSTPIDSYSNLGSTGIDPLNTLNPSNIKSIEILKDADATAIYGSRGANGVVLITTKLGRLGGTELEARVYTGVSTVPNRLNLLNTRQYLQIRNRAFENDEVDPTAANAYDLLIWDQNQYTDWQELFFGGSSPVTNVNLHTSGGNANTRYRLSGSYYKQGTVFLGDYDYNKVTAGLHVNHTSENKKLNIDLSLNYGVDINNLVGYLDLSSYAFRLPPNAPAIFNEDGSLHWEEWSAVGQNNPLVGFHNSSVTRGNNLVSNVGLSYRLAKGLTLKTNLGYTNFNGDEVVKRPQRSYNPSSWESINHRSTHLISSRNSWIIEPQLTYSTTIGEGKLDAIIGSTFQESTNKGLGLQGEGYVSEPLIGNLEAAESVIAPFNQNTDYRYNAIFARLGYNWKQKYFINLTGRRDGSSRFGPGKRLANFGAVGAAWIFYDEAFIKRSIPFLSFGKFRGSFGTTGNDQIGDYGYLDAYESTLGPGGLYPSQLSNPDYSWELNKKLEAAVELGFIEDRINISLSWYRNRSSNQLVGYPLPAITGFTTVQANLPATVQNTGWEVELSSYNIQSKDVLWQTSLNVSFPRNELISYPDLDQSSYANTYRIGQPLNISLLYNYEGIDPETGYYRITDVNEDGRFDYQDRDVVWHRGREFFGGLNNNFNYKNFSLQFLVQFVKQEGSLSLFNAGDLSIQREDVMQALEENSRYQRISSSLGASRAYSNVLSSTFPIVDASFLRLKTLSLGYSLPARALRPLGLNELKLFLSGQNLLTVTSYSGMDPEMPIDGTSFSALRTITGGLQLNF